tara:strand:+ start:858 stop:1499 length:642 start_codon:yes stop_codon:yes gene_type:complete
MQIVEKPWGHEKIWANTDRYVGKLLVINPGHKLSKQYHEVKDETIYVLEGQLSLEIGDEEPDISILEPGEAYHVEPLTIHRFVATDKGCTLLEVSTPELEDVVRLEDDYGREADDEAPGAKKRRKKKVKTWSRAAQIWLLEQMVNKVEPYSPKGLAQRMRLHFPSDLNCFTAVQIQAKARYFARRSNGRLLIPKRDVDRADIAAIIKEMKSKK